MVTASPWAEAVKKYKKPESPWKKAVVDFGGEGATKPAEEAFEGFVAEGAVPTTESPWWEKVGEVVKWLPPVAIGTAITEFGSKAIEAVDLPFMINLQAKQLTETQKAGAKLNEEEEGFLNLYKEEVGNPPSYSTFERIVAALHPIGAASLLWSGTKLKPSEDLKGAYYNSTGIGWQIAQGLATPLSAALIITGIAGGGTAAYRGLGAVTTRPGVVGKLGKAGQMIVAPMAGIEHAAGYVPSKIMRGIMGMKTLVQRVKWARINATIQRRILNTLDDILKVNPDLQAKATPEALSRIAGGADDLLRASRVREIRWDTIFKEWGIKKYPSSIVINAENRALNNYIRWGLEFASPAKTDVAIGILRNIGYTTEAIGRMSVEAAWKNIVTKLGVTGAVRALARAYKPIVEVISPVVTETGEPFSATVYRGTGLAPTDEGLVGKAEYWTTDPEYAATYGTVTESAVELNNPLVINTQSEWDAIAARTHDLRHQAAIEGKTEDWIQAELRTQLEAEGYDGVVIAEGIVETGKQVAVFHPEEAIKEYAPTAAMAEWETVSTNVREALELTNQIGKSRLPGTELDFQKKLSKAIGKLTSEEYKQYLDLLHPEITPEVTKPVEIPKVSEKSLRQSIMATVKTKGLSESKYRALFKRIGGTRNLTEMGADKLNAVLEAVREARPIKIQGKNVITAKTENAIRTLKDILVSEKKLTPEMYENLKKYLDLPTDRYESRELFITERQARNLIRQMNVEAEVGLTRWDVMVSEGLTTRPELKVPIDSLTARIVKENKPKPKKQTIIPFKKTATEISEFPDDVKLSGTMSILRALRRFQEQLGGREATRIYEVAEMLVEQRRLNDIALANTINAMKMEVPQLATIVKDKDAMTRIQRWLDADLKIVDIVKPDLVPAELEVAQLFRARYDQWKNTVRLERFKDAYYHYGGRAKETVAELIKHGTEGTSDVAIPDAPLKDIKEAITIYETQGEAALKAYLDTKDWGVLKSGYSFSQILHPKLRMYRGTSVRAATTSLHQRKGLEFLRDEKTPWERLIAYERQMIGLNLQPYYRKMDVEFRKAAETGRLSDQGARDAANKISLFMREVKGYPIESPIVALLLRIGGWSFGTLSKVPWMSVRNIHQNVAFGVDKSEIVKAITTKGFFRNPLTKRGRLDYTDALVHQYKGVQQEQILMGYMGKTPIENLIRRTDYYHLSDKLNRYLCMAGQGAKAERALNQYLKDRDVEKFLQDSGAIELSATEQLRILEYLALETYDYGGTLEAVSGGEAAIRDIANKITTLIHFNYVRYLRSVIEMGESGRIIGSLVAFPRSVTERYVDIFSRIKRLGGAERKRGIHALIAMVVGSVIASEMLRQITGKERDAYNPLLVLQWQVGGIAIGATQNIMEFYRLVTNLTFAEDEGQQKYYLDEIIVLIPQLGDSFIPFYAVTMNMLESLVDSRYLDRKWLRQLREVFDENYEMNEEYYQTERTLLEKIQHGLFGARTPDPTDLEAALKKLEGTEDMLGKIDVEEFDKAREEFEETRQEALAEGRPFDYEFEYTEDDFIYLTNNLGSDINSAVWRLDPTEVIGENGFSPLVLQYLEYNELRDDYFDVPSDKRYDYRKDNPETDANLFFWSYVTTLQSRKAKKIVLQMIEEFGIPTSAIKGYENVFGVKSPWKEAVEEESPWAKTPSESPWKKAVEEAERKNILLPI